MILRASSIDADEELWSTYYNITDMVRDLLGREWGQPPRANLLQAGRRQTELSIVQGSELNLSSILLEAVFTAADAI